MVLECLWRGVRRGEEKVVKSDDLKQESYIDLKPNGRMEATITFRKRALVPDRGE
jgi:hypothetical protein